VQKSKSRKFYEEAEERGVTLSKGKKMGEYKIQDSKLFMRRAPKYPSGSFVDLRG